MAELTVRRGGPGEPDLARVRYRGVVQDAIVVHLVKERADAGQPVAACDGRQVIHGSASDKRPRVLCEACERA